MDTTLLIKGEDTKILSLSILYELPDKEENNRLIALGEKYGYSSLRTYLEGEDDDDDPMRKIGLEGANKLYELLSGVHDCKILVVAHAVTINSLVYWMFENNRMVRDLALDTCLDECQAIRVVTGPDGKIIDAEVI